MIITEQQSQNINIFVSLMNKIDTKQSEDSLDQQMEQLPLQNQIISNPSPIHHPSRTAIISIGIILIIMIIIIHSNWPKPAIKSQQTILKLVTLDDPSALCLDGSQGIYYIHQGNPQKILIFFGGGGWSIGQNYEQTIQAFYQRSFTKYGNSSLHPKTITLSHGIFKNNDDNYFQNWTIVWLSYCDGAGHQGSRQKPIIYKEKQLYFRGHNNTIAQLDSANSNNHIFSTTIKQIVVTGVSAGAVAAYQWVDYIKSKIHHETKLHFIVDSPIFLNRPTYSTNLNLFRAAYQNIINITNQQIGTPLQQCNKAYPNQLWKCMFFQYLHPFVKTPVFIIQSLYDTWSIEHILKLNCKFGSNSSQICSRQQANSIELYASDVKNLVQLIGQNKDNGIWAVSCFFHTIVYTYAYNDKNWKIPQYNGITPADAVQSWIQNKQNKNKHIDDVNWPNNHPCNKGWE